MYHYTGGVALAALKRWKEAEEHLEICVTSPGTYPAALQMEALKKLRLVQLIARGTVPPLPKYTHPQLLRLFKNTPYNAFVNAYPRNGPLMREIYDKERQMFSQVCLFVYRCLIRMLKAMYRIEILVYCSKLLLVRHGGCSKNSRRRMSPCTSPTSGVR